MLTTSLDRAADLWRQYILPYAGRAYLIAPAVSNGPSGKDWLNHFLAACQDCQISAIAVHWYDNAWNIQYFYDYMNDILALVNGRYGVWVTEFHANGDYGQQQSFLAQVSQWMDARYLMSNYAWFMAHPNPDVDAPLA